MTVLVDKLEKELARNCRLNNWDLGFQAAIDIVKQHSDWISVDERLPADNEEVLTYWSDEDVVIAYFMKGRFSFSDCSGEIITHWQPLPQPPSEVQNV